MIVLDLNTFLEYDDKLFMSFSPKIVYSKTEEDIIFINEEDECEYMQELDDDEIENSNEDLSSNQQNTNTSKLIERNEGSRYRNDKKNATLIQRVQMEEQMPNNQFEYTLDSKIQNDIQNQNNKYDNNAFNFQNSSEFSSHKSKSSKSKSNKNIKSYNPDEVLNRDAGKSKSLTSLNNDNDLKNYMEDELEVIQYLSQKILKDSLQTNQNNSGKKKKKTLVIEKNSLNLINSDAQGIVNNSKNYKDQLIDDDLIYNVKNSSNFISNNNNVNNNTFTSATNVDDSFITNQQNQHVYVQVDNDDQYLSKQIFGQQTHSEKIIQIPVSQMVQKKIEAELGLGRGQNRLDQEIKPKVKTKNVTNLIQSYQQNNNQQKTQISFQNSSEQSIKSPVLKQQNATGQQQQTKKNQNLQNPSSLNIQIAGNYPIILNNNNNNLPARASRISIHLNEPNNNTNQNLSINNLSHTQIREHSSYSRRTINSNISAIKSPPQQMQQQPSINPNQQYQTQNSQSLQNSQQNAPINRQYTIGQQILNRQGSTFTLTNPSNQKKQHTLIGVRQGSTTGTLIQASKSEIQKQNIINLVTKQNYQQEVNSLQQTIREQNLMILDFDLMKQYQNFFPHNNYDKVINQIKVKLKSMLTSQKKSGKVNRRQKKRQSIFQGNKKKPNATPSSKSNVLNFKSQLQDAKRISVNYINSQQKMIIKSKEQIPSNNSVQQAIQQYN